ncbi:MAG: hypothetical protein ACLP50_22910 [Solirubrobacteraceae bacterium]
MGPLAADVLDGLRQWPGPLSAGAVAGAWLHGALCGATAHARASETLPHRSATAADLLEAVRSFGARCEETGDSRAALARYGLRRDRDQPALAKLAPTEAVDAVRGETGMTAATASDLLGLIALDGMAVARTLLDRLARDPAPPGESAERDLASARHAADLLDLADITDITAGELMSQRRLGTRAAGSGTRSTSRSGCCR